MEKVSREMLDLALDSLKRQKTDDGKTGSWYTIADCYASCLPQVCRWDDIPGEHICAKCGKTFGTPEKTERRMFAVIDKDAGDMTAQEWDVKEVLKAYRSCKKAGYDVELDMHCSKCAKAHDLEPAVFRFRAPGENDHVISFPLFRSGIWFGMERPSDKHFYSWQYMMVADFLTRSLKKTTGQKDMWRRWMDHMAGSIYDFGSDPWEFVEGSLEGILGLSFKEPVNDVSDKIGE